MALGHYLSAATIGIIGLGLTACNTTEIIGSTVGATLLGANSPSQEIQQIYYLGAFDPQGQLPPTVYRIRVHGQASFISFVRFASGWVPAPFIDSLSSSVNFKDQKSTNVTVDKGASETLAKLSTGRRLMQFGPEGFREAPRDHRLVIVMGSSPESFFNAIDSSIGQVAAAQAKQRAETQDNDLSKDLFTALSALQGERTRLQTLNSATSAELPSPGGS